MNFQERLVSLREARGLNQDQLAEVLGLKSRSSISLWEIGKRQPPMWKVQIIADYFNVSVDYLMGRVDEPDMVCIDNIPGHPFGGPILSQSPDTIALSRSDNPEDDLPEEALKEIEEFKAFVRHKYKKPE